MARTSRNPHGERPQVDERVDALLAERLSAADHQAFWTAEAPTLGGFTPAEALEAGFREEVLDLAQGHPGMTDDEPLIAPSFVNDYLRNRFPSP